MKNEVLNSKRKKETDISDFLRYGHEDRRNSLEQLKAITGCKNKNSNPNEINKDFENLLKKFYLDKKDGLWIFRKLYESNKQSAITDYEGKIRDYIIRRFLLKYKNVCFYCKEKTFSGADYCTHCGKKIL